MCFKFAFKYFIKDQFIIFTLSIEHNQQKTHFYHPMNEHVNTVTSHSARAQSVKKRTHVSSPVGFMLQLFRHRGVFRSTDGLC